MTFTITVTTHGVVIGLMVFVALLSGSFAAWNYVGLKDESHGTVRLARGMSMFAAGFVCIIAAGVASLVSQYG